MNIKENAAYIKGLFDGFEIDITKKEGKIISSMIDLVSEMAQRIEDLEKECSELRDYIEELDEDLGAAEDKIYLKGEKESYDPEFEEDFDNDFEDDYSGYDELICPSCGETICVDENIELSEVSCPACGEKLADIELCDGDCSCCEGCEVDD